MNSELIFGNPIGLKKCWGSSSPKTFEYIFSYLAKEEFLVSSETWQDPLSLTLRKRINDDLSITLSFSQIYESPADVFHYDCAIVINSKYVQLVDSIVNIWDRDFSKISLKPEVGAALFVIKLSHLKWNTCPGQLPSWTVTSDESNAKVESEVWIKDWKEFGNPWIEQFQDTEDVINYLVELDNYKRSPWVKSDGPKSAGKFVFIGILLEQLGRKEESAELLSSILQKLTNDTTTHKLTLSDIRLKNGISKVYEWLGKK